MKLIDILRRCRHKLYELKQLKYPNVSSKATIRNRVTVLNRKNLYMQEHASLSSDSLIMNGRARFKMGANSMAAVGLTVVTGDHMSLKGKLFRQVTDEVKDKLDVHHRYDSDVIVEEDVWIGTHVTLLNGCHIGRGAIVGGGA
jgi:acetyltransferase-like isoleucine patch superfamily enzyme